MAKNQNATNIQVYRKKPNFNVGLIIFIVIFIYLAATILIYLTKTHIVPYEVREGSILKDNAYTGFMIRDEEVISADGDGYINFFALEGSKVGAKTCVYTLSDSKLNFESNTEESAQELTAEEQQAVFMKIQGYTETFNEQQFSDVYTLKNNISSVLNGQNSQSRQNQLDTLSLNGSENIQTHYATEDGIIEYSIDGFEAITEDTVTEAMIAKDDYQVTTVKDNTKVSKGTPVYKIIRDNDWKIAILLSDSAAKELADLTSVKVLFTKDNETMWASFQIKKQNGANIAILSFDNSMVRYCDERYIDIELITTDETGLKIPKSAVTKKDFYIVPEEYLTQGGTGNSTGVLIDTGKDNAEFQSVDVYYTDTEKQQVYLNPDVFDKNTVLRKEDSSDTFTLNETGSLEGVYNINKGYAEFRIVHILYESDEYYIIQSDDPYGLSNYDHIALNGADVREDDVVY